MVRVVSFALLWACAATGARGQDALKADLDRLAAASDDLQKRLPNFVCRETLVSQELRGDQVKTEVRASGNLRIERGAGGKLEEHFQAAERNGKPIQPNKLKLPVFVTGGFQHVLDIFQPEVQSCFRFRLSGDRLNFESAPDGAPPNCSDHSGTTGFALLDPQGNITHFERRVAAEDAQRRKAAPFAAIDLKRVELGAAWFSLSSHVTADLPRGNAMYHWEASYTECRLFHVSVTLGPASDPVPQPNP